MLTAVALLGVSACGTGSAQPGAAGTTVTVPELPAGALAPSEHPVGREWRQRYEWANPAEYNRAFYGLYQEATAVCMAERGFDYQPYVYFDDASWFTAMNPLNRSVASTFGYHAPPEVEWQLREVTDPNARRALYGDDDYDDDGDGIGEGDEGCARPALRYAIGPAGDAFSELHGVAVPAIERGLTGWSSSPGATAALGAWVSCMSERGYGYDHPDDARFTFAEEPSVTSEELTVRRADLECDVESGFTVARSAWEQAFADAWVADNAETVGEVSAALDAAVRQTSDRLDALRSDGAAALADA